MTFRIGWQWIAAGLVAVAGAVAWLVIVMLPRSRHHDPEDNAWLTTEPDRIAERERTEVQAAKEELQRETEALRYIQEETDADRRSNLLTSWLNS